MRRWTLVNGATIGFNPLRVDAYVKHGSSEKMTVFIGGCEFVIVCELDAFEGWLIACGPHAL